MIVSITQIGLHVPIKIVTVGFKADCGALGIFIIGVAPGRIGRREGSLPLFKGNTITTTEISIFFGGFVTIAAYSTRNHGGVPYFRAAQKHGTVWCGTVFSTRHKEREKS